MAGKGIPMPPSNERPQASFSQSRPNPNNTEDAHSSEALVSK